MDLNFCFPKRGPHFGMQARDAQYSGGALSLSRKAGIATSSAIWHWAAIKLVLRGFKQDKGDSNEVVDICGIGVIKPFCFLRKGSTGLKGEMTNRVITHTHRVIHDA